MKPLISILIPAYNSERWVGQTLQSAVDQDYPNKEIILVNDGSTDKTLEIAKGFESKNVKIIDQPNSGGPAARNAALAHAQGDYIQWLDHDDILAVDKISSQATHIADGIDDRVLISGRFGTFYFRPENAKFTTGPLWKDLTPLEYFYAKFNKDSWIHTTCWLVSRRLTEMAGPWLDLRSPDDDGEYFCRVVAASKSIKFIPTATSYWRIGNIASFSYSRKRSVKSLQALLESTFRCINHFRALEDTESSREACVTFLRNRLIYFYPEHPELLEKMYALAAEFGGKLSTPPLLPHYERIKAHFGWRVAKTAQDLIPTSKQFVLRSFDRLMFAFDRDTPGAMHKPTPG